MKRAALILFLLVPAWGQVAAPLLGYLPDGKQVRPVYGTVAAASVADAIRTGEDVGHASAVRESVLILDADAGAISVFTGGVLKYIPGTRNAPDMTALSPTGQAAVLWFQSNASVQILSALAGTPALRNVDASFRGSAPTALAVSDDGQWMSGAWPDGTYAFGPLGEVLQLQVDGAAAAVEFFPGSHDLGVATARGLWIVTDVGGRTAPRSLWQAPLEEAFDVIALAGAARRLYAATRAGTILMVPLGDGDVGRVSCECQPVGLARMAGNAFRLTGPVNNAIKLFDADSAAVYFAPIRPLDLSNRTGGRSR